VLVGFNTNDDAGVYLLADGLAIVQTVDFFTPIVDDPFTFGQIAATNSLSDVYAMGGKPISALSIVGFPEKGDPAILEQIIRGGLDKMNEAKCSVVGGHSIRNDDIQFGYAVTGLIHPQKIWRNVGVQASDVLLLTKPLGTGVISTALKNDRVTKEALDASIRSMTTLNRASAEALTKLESQFDAKQRPIHAVTDVTGFGLLGHAREMALGDGTPDVPAVSLEFDHTLIAALPGAMEAIRAGMIPGGLKNNRDFLGECVTFDARVPEESRALLYDPQTSGGLLIAIDPSAADQALKALQENGVAAAKIGTVRPKTTSLLKVI
jgi:selenide,water dikinase